MVGYRWRGQQCGTGVCCMGFAGAESRWTWGVWRAVSAAAVPDRVFEYACAETDELRDGGCFGWDLHGT